MIVYIDQPIQRLHNNSWYNTIIILGVAVWLHVWLHTVGMFVLKYKTTMMM